MWKLAPLGCLLLASVHADELGVAKYRVSPDVSAHGSVVAEKCHKIRTKPSWVFVVADLARIKRSFRILAGDQDFVSIEESARIYRATPGAKRFILPGTGSTTFQDRPDWLNPALRVFLDQK